MDIERIEVEHNKIVTIIFCILDLVAIIGLCVLIAMSIINLTKLTEVIGLGVAITLLILLSLCVLVFVISLVCQIAKFRYNIIFVADEEGIRDYSRNIILAPITYSEIQSIEYKDFLSDGMSDFKHLKIVLKSTKDYMKKLNFIQKISFYLRLQHFDLHLFCAKTPIKIIAEKLIKNLEIYNQTNNL